MSTQTADYERLLVGIIRALPAERAAQLVDFARFLEAQSLAEMLSEDEEAKDVEEDNARWDTLLASAEAQALLDTLADEALAEHRAGRTKMMVFKDDGRIEAE
ncbi:MAG: hypothetical protein M3511_12110 [Deinococcota bacterium]|jgi:hypothetical protein|nr:hypothetical protein [Deinococcota bacterium]